MSALNARCHVLDMIRSAAERAAEKGVEVTIKYSEFTVDGKIEASITATPKPRDAAPSSSAGENK